MNETSDICGRCYSHVAAKDFTGGSIAIELALWFFSLLVAGFFCPVQIAFLPFFPALLYSLWRLTTRRRVCPRCQSAELVPLDTPKGRMIATAAAKVTP